MHVCITYAHKTQNTVNVIIKRNNKLQQQQQPPKWIVSHSEWKGLICMVRRKKESVWERERERKREWHPDWNRRELCVSEIAFVREFNFASIDFGVFCFRVRLSILSISTHNTPTVLNAVHECKQRQYWLTFYRSELLRTKHECVRYEIPFANRHTMSNNNFRKPKYTIQNEACISISHALRHFFFALFLSQLFFWIDDFDVRLLLYACNIGNVIMCECDWMCSQQKKTNKNRRRAMQ